MSCRKNTTLYLDCTACKVNYLAPGGRVVHSVAFAKCNQIVTLPVGANRIAVYSTNTNRIVTHPTDTNRIAECSPLDNGVAPDPLMGNRISCGFPKQPTIPASHKRWGPGALAPGRGWSFALRRTARPCILGFGADSPKVWFYNLKQRQLIILWYISKYPIFF